MNYENFLDETKTLFQKGDELINNEKYDEAIACFEQAVKVQSDNYGKEHESTVACMTQLGMCYLVNGTYDKAIDVLDEALAIALKIFRYESQDVANLYYLLGSAHMQLGDYDNASEELGHVVLISTKVYGPNANETESARGIYNQAMALKEKNNTEEDAELAAITSEAECYKKGGEYFDGGMPYIAIKYFAKAIRLHEELEEHEDDILVGYLRSLAVAYTEVHLEDDSLNVLERLLPLCTKLYGEIHTSVSGAYNLMSYNYLVKNEYAKSIDSMNKSIKINIKIYGDQSMETANDYSILSKIYALSGDMDKGIASAVIASGILENIDDEDKRPMLIACYDHLASLYAGKKELEAAISYLEKELELAVSVYGAESGEVLNVYNHLGYCYKSNGMDDRAEAIIETMSKIMENIGMSDMPEDEA